MKFSLHRVLRRTAAVALCLGLLCGSVTALTACSSPKTVATLGEHELSVNLYQFLLSRIKGTLGQNGYSVNSADFWNTIVDSDGTTYDEFFRQNALSQAREYLAALALFEEKGLTLPQSEYDRIDTVIDEHLAAVGSKTALNSELASYGVNVNMLREFYIIEAKFGYVKDSIYGQDGSLVSAQVRQEYLEDNAVAFRYVLIRSFDYVYVTDDNGDEVYFLPNENNAKVNNIAYDKENGTVRLDEDGNVIKDDNQENVYYLENGHIAYDKVNGVRARAYDSDGIAMTEKLSSAELSVNKTAAENILATVESGDYAAFEALLAEYEADETDYFETDGTLAFLYTTGDNTSDYLNDIADQLAEVAVGELCNIYTSEYGYNVVMRYPIPSDAVTNSDYEEWFGDLVDRVVSRLFYNECKSYMEQVTIDESALDDLPSMAEVGINYYY